MKRVMAAALAVFTAAGLLAGSAFAAQENARVKEIENTLMKQIGEMPKTGGGEKLGAKIRKTELEKVPHMFVIGKKEAEAGAVSLRSRIRKEFEGVRPADEAITLIVEDIKQRNLPDGFGA